MQTFDPAGDALRPSEHYRQLCDGELVSLAQQASELTDAARLALAQEIASRRLKVPPKESATPRSPEPPPYSAGDDESPYAEDRQLVVIRTVWSLADALKLQRLLDTASIPFYMGPEKATGVDAVTSNFANGQDVQIMQVGVPWARPVLEEYFPADEPPDEKVEASDDLAIHCPRCHSKEVVFEKMNRGLENAGNDPSSKFKWTCDACGRECEDDGLVTR